MLDLPACHTRPSTPFLTVYKERKHPDPQIEASWPFHGCRRDPANGKGPNQHAHTAHGGLLGRWIRIGWFSFKVERNRGGTFSPHRAGGAVFSGNFCFPCPPAPPRKPRLARLLHVLGPSQKPRHGDPSPTNEPPLPPHTGSHARREPRPRPESPDTQSNSSPSRFYMGLNSDPFYYHHSPETMIWWKPR